VSRHPHHHQLQQLSGRVAAGGGGISEGSEPGRPVRVVSPQSIIENAAR